MVTDGSTFSLVIPFGEVEGHTERYQILQGVVAYYARKFINLEIVISQVSRSPSIGPEVSDLPGVRLVHTARVGWNPSTARNAGVRAATRDILVLMDADAIVGPQQITEAISRMLELGPRVFMSIGDVLHYVPQGVLQAGDPYLAALGHSVHKVLGHSGPICATLRRQTFDLVGGFDEVYERWGVEDTDFILRLGHAGAQIRAAPGVVHHVEHPMCVMKEATLGRRNYIHRGTEEEVEYRSYKRNTARLADLQERIPCRVIDRLGIYCRSGCNLACTTCNQQEWRSADPSYSMGPDEICALIKALRESGYHVTDLVISGGEPTQWKYLDYTIRMMLGCAPVDGVSVFTNGMQPDKLITLADRHEQLTIYTSYYGQTNVSHLRQLKAANRRNIKIRDKSTHVPTPTEYVPGTVPGSCSCIGYGVRDRKVFFCQQAEHLLHKFPDMAAPGFVTDLSPGFLDRLVTGLGRQSICGACTMNRAVQAKLGKVPIDTGR